MTDAIIAGVVGGIISPLILAFLKHFFVWRAEKLVELKSKIFDEAISALAKRSADALDRELQSQKQTSAEFRMQIKFRPETLDLIERARFQVHAFFLAETATKFHKALCAKLSLDDLPPLEFEEARRVAVLAMASELGVTTPNWVVALTSRWRGTR